jgi:uncharacterized protein YjbK
MIEMLKKAGNKGVTNVEFSKVANCYTARLSELYSAGYIISVENLGEGVYKYTLEYEPNNPKKAKKKVDELIEKINKDFSGVVTLKELDSLLTALSINISRKSFPNTKKIFDIN